MVADAAERGAYLRALGIEQWQPRAHPLEPTAEPATPVSERVEVPEATVAVPVEPQAVQVVSVEPAPVSVEVVDPVAALPTVEIAPAPAPAPVATAMPRGQLQDNLGAEALDLAQVQWHTPPNGTARLAVLGIDADGTHLKSRDFEQDWGVLQKMLAAIGVELNSCAVGGLNWDGEPSSNLQTPYALILVDSGEDGAALINYWQGKQLTVQGARAVIAPHPCMFVQGVTLKRQAWASLQMLQQLWTD